MGSSIDDFLKEEGIFEESQAQAVKEVLVAKYHERTGHMAQAHLCEIADGAR